MEAVIAAGLLLPDLTRSVAEEHLDELEKLIETAGGNVVGKVLARRPAPDPATFVGQGKAEQIELDRRIIRNRIAHLKEELRKIERTRETQRKARSSAYTVALVGYTNAGKSTLFNQLTRGGAVAVDKLFATLDAKSQRAAFEMPRETVVIDTVGFIRKLPHNLVASFRSTMEEAVAADLVLHVIEVSPP